MKTIRVVPVVAAAAIAVLSAPIHTYAADDMGKMDMSSSKGEVSATTEGEVKKVDKDAGKITIKHGPISNLQMPGMTMVFNVSDPAMLDQLKQGDKVKFRAEKIKGELTVVSIQVNR